MLRTAVDLAAAPRELVVWPDLGRRPLFDADVEETALPGVAAELRSAVGAADGLRIVSPEYADGTSGALKNALEWMVGGGEIAAKPVALVSASTSTTGGGNARAWLAQTLTVMGAQVIPQDLRVSQAMRKIEDGRLTDGPTVAAPRDLLDGLADAAATAREVGSPFARVNGALLS